MAWCYFLRPGFDSLFATTSTRRPPHQECVVLLRKLPGAALIFAFFAGTFFCAKSFFPELGYIFFFGFCLRMNMNSIQPVFWAAYFSFVIDFIKFPKSSFLLFWDVSAQIRVSVCVSQKGPPSGSPETSSFFYICTTLVGRHPPRVLCHFFRFWCGFYGNY